MGHHGLRWMLVAVFFVVAVGLNVPRGWLVRKRPRRLPVAQKLKEHIPSRTGSETSDEVQRPLEKRPAFPALPAIKRSSNQADAA